LHAAITDAASGDAKAIDTALTKTQSRIGALGEEKPANYESAFRETPRTVGDLVEHLETAAKDTRAGDPATEAALKRWSERVREKLGSAEGVSEPGIATTIENLETRMAGEKDLAKRADLSRSIGELRAAFKAEPTYDPKTPLDPLELRSLVSDVQSPAAELAYTHDRTAAGKVAHDTAVPFMDFLRTWLDEAGSKGGDAAEAVDAIRESNKKFEALLTARNALEQRASYATANNVQAVTPSFAQFFRQHPAGAGLGAAGLGSLIALHPGAAGATAAAGLTAYAAKRAAAEIINGAAAGKLTPLMIQAALKQGVSPEIVNAARQIADQAARRNVANATR